MRKAKRCLSGGLFGLALCWLSPVARAAEAFEFNGCQVSAANTTVSTVDGEPVQTFAKNGSLSLSHEGRIFLYCCRCNTIARASCGKMYIKIGKKR